MSITSLIVILLLTVSRSHAVQDCCVGHGGVARCDSAEAQTVCEDGSTDKQCRCTGKTYRRRKPYRRVLKFKPAPDRGQVLHPGQEPPATTLEKSK
jgi:hypothetical protein